MNHSEIKDLFPRTWIPGVHPKFQDAAQAAQMVALAATPKAKHEAKRKVIAELLKALKAR